MDEEQIQELLTVSKQVLTAVLADDELSQLQAKTAKKTFDSFITEGFNEDQAIKLTAASVKSLK